jgi:hypothetical protein
MPSLNMVISILGCLVLLWQLRPAVWLPILLLIWLGLLWPLS